MKRRLSFKSTDGGGFLVRTDKRREQSKSAARSRRRIEAEVFVDLAEVLPFNQSERTVYQVDRIAILRLAVTYYQLRRLANSVLSTNVCEPSTFHQNSHETKPVLNVGDATSLDCCLDGFLIIVSQSGHMLYISNGISQYIGFTQADLMGRPFKDYVHVDDWRDVDDQIKSPSNHKSNIFFRMKTALTPRGGRSRKLTTAICQAMKASVTIAENALYGNENCYYVYCVPVSNIANHRNLGFVNSLMTRHEIDMKFRFCEEKLASLLQHKNSKVLIGQSLYQFIHPEDLQHVVCSFRQLYKKGHCTTDYYRMMTKTGDYIWIVSEASLITQNVRGVHQKYVICNHQVLSDVENELGTVFDKNKNEKVVFNRESNQRPRLTKTFCEHSQMPEIKIKQEPSDYSSCDSSLSDSLYKLPSCVLSNQSELVDLKPSINNIFRYDFEGISTDWSSSIFSLKDDLYDDDLTCLAPFVADDILDLVKYDDLPWNLKRGPDGLLEQNDDNVSCHSPAIHPLSDITSPTQKLLSLSFADNAFPHPSESSYSTPSSEERKPKIGATTTERAPS